MSQQSYHPNQSWSSRSGGDTPLFRDEVTLGLHLYPDADTFLEPLGLSEREISEFQEEYYLQGPRKVMQKILFAEYAGLPLPEGKMIYTQVGQLYGFPPYEEMLKFYAEETPFTGKLTSSLTSAFRGAILRDRFSIGTYLGPSLTASRVFSLSLTKEAYNELYNHLSSGNPEHLPGTFGFVRYHRGRNGIIQVLEVKSDLYDRITDPEIRKRYSGWMRELLRSFDHFLSSPNSISSFGIFSNLSDSERVWLEHNSLLVEVPSAASLAKKWAMQVRKDEMPFTVPKDVAGLKVHVVPEVRASHYRRVHRILATLGYNSSRIPRNIVEPRYGNKENIQSRLTSSKRYSPFLTPNRTPCFLPIDNDRFNELVAAEKALFPQGMFSSYLLSRGVSLALPVPKMPDLHDRRAVASLASAFVLAPAREFPPRAMELVTKGALERRDILLSTRSLDWLSKSMHDFTPISRGAGFGISSAWWEVPQNLQPGWNAQPLHIEGQNRHPVVRMIEADDEGNALRIISVGFKGAGLRERGNEHLKIPDNAKEMRLPIYRRIEASKDVDPGDIVYATHELWGGMALAFAVNEFSNSLNLLDLVSQAAPELVDLVPIPLSVHEYSALPVWDKEGAMEWVGCEEYVERYLDFDYGHSSSPTVFKTIAPSDVRLSQLAERIFGRKEAERANVFDAKDEIDSALRILYLTYGEPLVLPREAPTPDSEGISTRSVLSYLASVYELNSDAAERILVRFNERTTKLMGVVHGAGGHLGGGMTGPVGCPNGGGVAIRNIGIFGDVHDFDASIYFPWAMIARVNNQHRMKEHGALSQMQQYDAIYLGESQLWMRHIVQGLKTEFEVHTMVVKIAPDHDLTLFVSEEPRNEEIARALLQLSPAMEVSSLLLSPESKIAYGEGVDEGRSAAHRICDGVGTR